MGSRAFLVLTLTAFLNRGVAQDCSYWDESSVPSVTVEKSGDFYTVSLTGGLNTEYIDHWEVRSKNWISVADNSPLSYEEKLQFDPQDCINTKYLIVMTARCPTSDHAAVAEDVVLGEQDFPPIPLDQLSWFKQTDYRVLRAEFVKSGEGVTLTCQTKAEVSNLYGDKFKPYYTWLKEIPFSTEEPILAGPSQDLDTLVIDSVQCKDAGYYYCKVTKCPNHSLLTSACNNYDIAVQQTAPVLDYRKCKVFGDPHVITFDGSMYSYKGQCWYVLATEHVRKAKWYVYGWFNACGETSSCLETVSIITKETDSTSKAQIQLLRGYGMSIDGKKLFIKRDTSNTHKNGISMLFVGDSLTVSIPEFGLQVKWDGLSVVTIRVNQNTPTLGLCGNNDGNPSNDYSSFYDKVDRTSDQFADAWSIGVSQCILSPDFPEEKASFFSAEDLLKSGVNPSNFPVPILRSICLKSVYGSSGSETQLSFVAALLPKERLDFIIEACVFDIRNSQWDFFDKRHNFPGCIALSMIADEAEELGVCLESWQVTARCPLRIDWREESIRIGCLWTQEDFDTVRS